MAKKGPKGRPTLYSEKLASGILARMAGGESLRSICVPDDMPAASTVRGWVVENRDGFSERYARARALQVEHWADEILSISDDGAGDTWIDDEGNERVNSDVIQRSKLRIDTRKWLMSKLVPKQFGDKQSLEVAGQDGGPLNVTVTRRVVSADADG